MLRTYKDVFTLKSDFTEEELWNAYKFKYKFALTIIDNIERNNYLEKLNVYFQEAKKDLKKKS